MKDLPCRYKKKPTVVMYVIRDNKVNDQIDTWKLKKALRVTHKKTGSDGLCRDNKKSQ